MLKQFTALLGRSTKSTTFQSTSPKEAAKRALFDLIAERSKTDPLIGAKIGSKEVTQRMIDAMKTPEGVHIESLLCALGSLAGYSCQAALRAQALARNLPETAFLLKVQTNEGRTYFFGDDLNRLLVESRYSVWSVVAGGAEAAGCAKLPDIREIFEYSISTLGKGSYGLPRVPEKNLPQDLPINYVEALWPYLAKLIREFCPDPQLWPVLLSLSIQEVLEMGKDVIDPCTGTLLVMESAVSMSKVDIGKPQATDPKTHRADCKQSIQEK